MDGCDLVSVKEVCGEQLHERVARLSFHEPGLARLLTRVSHIVARARVGRTKELAAACVVAERWKKEQTKLFIQIQIAIIKSYKSDKPTVC